MIIPAKEQTSAAVAQHYDDLDPFYRELWGDHVHHGLWTTGLENPAQAVENLIACVARRLELDPGQHVCDVGCGYGATAQWLAEHHGVHVTGLTISAVQAQRASERSTGSSQLRFLWRGWVGHGFLARGRCRVFAGARIRRLCGATPVFYLTESGRSRPRRLGLQSR